MSGRLNIDGYPILCANCGGETGSLISIGDGETVCSMTCFAEHERLGCPFEKGALYRPSPTLSAPQKGDER